MPFIYIGRALTLSWILSIAIIGLYASSAVTNGLGAIYLPVVTIVQASILMIPLFIVQALHRKFESRWLAWLIYLFSYGLLVLLLSNYKLYSMYSFFIDGFVINLLTTPGGIDALGLSASFYRSAAIAIGAGAIVYTLGVRFLPLERVVVFHSKKLVLSLGFFALLIGETLSFAWASYTATSEVLSVSSKVVWHIPVTARQFFEKLGVEASTAEIKGPGKTHSSKFTYPAVPIPTSTAPSPYNVIWLTCESLRYDVLTPRIMPKLYAFAQESNWFQSHYSGSNGTRMGMFSQFYGLYPSYWKDVLNNRQSPPIIDTLIASHYNMKAFTSARFTYPEFDKTIFSKFSPDQLQEYHKGRGWQRDEKKHQRYC